MWHHHDQTSETFRIASIAILLPSCMVYPGTGITIGYGRPAYNNACACKFFMKTKTYHTIRTLMACCINTAWSVESVIWGMAIIIGALTDCGTGVDVLQWVREELRPWTRRRRRKITRASYLAPLLDRSLLPTLAFPPSSLGIESYICMGQCCTVRLAVG